MSIRPLKMPADAETFKYIGFQSFQYPENPEWSVQEDERENLVDQIDSIRRLWPLFRFIGLIYPKFRDFIGGYIWEEDGNPVGLVIVQPTSIVGGDSWTVNTEAVLPAYRRRGIARWLVETSLEFVKQKGAKTVMLSVFSQNKPAYEIYKSLGFNHYGSNVELYREHGIPFTGNSKLPKGYNEETLSRAHWQPRYNLAKRIIPSEIQVFQPVTKSDYHPPFLIRLLIRLLDIFTGRVEKIYALYESTKGANVSEEIIGIARYTARLKPGGTNNLRIQLDPSHPDLSSYLVSKLVSEVTVRSPGRRIRLAQPDWGTAVIDSALKINFKIRIEWHDIGLKIS